MLYFQMVVGVFDGEEAQDPIVQCIGTLVHGLDGVNLEARAYCI